MTETIPLCSICEQPMTPLPERTGKQGLIVYVCRIGRLPGRRKPCDGPVPAALKNDA